MIPPTEFLSSFVLVPPFFANSAMVPSKDSLDTSKNSTVPGGSILTDSA